MEEINLLEVLKTLKKHIVTILLTSILFGLIFFAYNKFFVKPIYEANTTIMIREQKNDSKEKSISYNDVMVNQKLVATYSEIIKSREIISRVISNLTLKESPEQVKSMVKLSNVKDSELINIAIQNENPTKATNIANDIAIIFGEYTKTELKADNVKIINKAVIPTFPISPNVKIKTLLGLFLGLALSSLIYSLVSILDKTVRTEERLKENIDIPVLGVIPDKDSKNLKGKHKYYSNSSLYDESLSMLRTNISFSSINKELKTLLITSSQPSEGKSTLIVSLARSLALNNKKVLLIDCDLRNPSVGKRSDNAHNVGLVNILIKNLPLERAIIKDAKVNGVDMILTGPKPPNPAELISSEKMKNFIEQMKPYYDYILIDSPPAGILSDARILSTMVDGVLVVVSQNEANITLVKSTIESLKQVSANVIGVVMTKANVEKHSKYGYGYGNKDSKK